MQQFLNVIRSPMIGCIAGAILAASALSEFLDKVEDPPIGAHHGALAYGIFQIARSLAEVIEKASKLKQEARELKSGGERE